MGASMGLWGKGWGVTWRHRTASDVRQFPCCGGPVAGTMSGVCLALNKSLHRCPLSSHRAVLVLRGPRLQQLVPVWTSGPSEISPGPFSGIWDLDRGRGLLSKGLEYVNQGA